MGEAWGFIWIMFALKIPLAMLLYIVWYAIKAQPDTAAEPGGDGGSGRRHVHRRPLPHDPRKRGPHGGAAVAPPERTRTHARAVSRSSR